MSGLATGFTGGSAGHLGGPARRPLHVLEPSGRMATSVDLMPPGGGLVLPDLHGIPLGYPALADEAAGAVLAGNLIRAGVGRVGNWAKAEGSALKFVHNTLDEWLDCSGRLSVEKNFFFEVTLSGRVDPNSYYGEDAQLVPRKLSLSLHVDSSGYVVLGPTLRILEREHPRLPATFFHLFAGSVSHWVRVYDYRDALERVECLKEWMGQDPEGAAEYELPDVEGAIPASIKGKLLSTGALKRLLPGMRRAKARQIINAAVVLAEKANLADRPPLGEEVQQEIAECNPPVPALLAVFEKQDAIEGCFDEEAQTMLEMPPEPNVILPFDGTDVESAQRAFYMLKCLVETLACASRLIETLPGNEQVEGVRE